MPDLTPQLPWIVAGATAIGVAIVGKLLGVDIDVGVNPPHVKVTRHEPAAPVGREPVLPADEPPAPSAPTEVERERDQLREAMFYYSQAAQALDGLLECNPSTADDFAAKWFDSLATWLATSLRTSAAERYRVSIWRNGDDPVNFEAVGLGMFSSNDIRMKKLTRAGTIGGEAFTSAVGERYCKDIRDPECGWTPRSTPTPPYKSIFAVALGETPSRWGVITIDCNIVDGFSAADRQVARHFGELVVLGALIWRLKAVRPSTETRDTT